MKFTAKRNKPISETQLVSLADITFLIIFFFMLTSSFMKDKVQVPLPELPTKVAKTVGVNTVTIDANLQMYLNGESVGSKESLEAELKNLLADKTRPEDLEVRLKCDRNVTYKDYKGAIEAISNAGGIICVMHKLSQTTVSVNAK